MAKYVRFEKSDGIGIITIDRPEALNALNLDVLHEIEARINEIEKDKELRVVILTGSGRSFVAGADISYMREMGVAAGREWGRYASALFRRIELLEIPTIAAVNGFALGGGCELAMTCDVIVASEKAKFGQPEVGLGVIPGFSGTQRLPRRIGAPAAKELIFGGGMIDAARAAEIGLVQHVYPGEELMDKAKELAQSFAKNAPIAVKYAKAAIDRGMQTDIDSGIAIENELWALCFTTEDQKEGMAAFLEKRPAEFKNK